MEKKIREYILYQKNDFNNEYIFVQSNEQTLGVLFALIYDFHPDITKLKHCILNINSQQFCSESVSVFYESGRITLSSAYTDFSDESRDFISTVVGLCSIIDSWERVYKQHPNYIFVQRDTQGDVSIFAMDDAMGVLNLPYTVIQTK